MKIKDRVHRGWARISGPILARTLSASGVLKTIDDHLAAGRITVAGQMAQASLHRFASKEKFQIRLGRYHYARSEWEQVLEVLDNVRGFEEARLLRAQAALNLKQSDQALELLANVESEDGLWFLVDVSLRQRNVTALAEAISRLVPETGHNAADQLDKLFRKPPFKFYLHGNRARERQFLISQFGPRLQRAFVIFCAANGCAVQTLNDLTQTQSSDPVFEVLDGLAIGLIRNRKLKAVELVQPNWLGTLYEWLGVRTLSRVFSLTNLSLRSLVEVDSTFGENSLELDDNARFMIDFAGLQSSMERFDLDVEQDFVPRLNALLTSDKLSIVDGALLLQEVSNRFEDVAIIQKGLLAFIGHRKFKQDAALSSDFAESFVWMDLNSDLRPVYDEISNLHPVSILSAIESTTLERRLIRFERAVERDPDDLNLRGLAIREALRQDQPGLVEEWIAQAKGVKSLDKENMARLYLQAQDWVAADQAFEATKPSLSATARRGWIRSLFQRGYMSKALEIDPQGTGLETRCKEVMTSVNYLQRQFPMLHKVAGPNDLIPVLENLVPEVETSTKGTTLVTSTLRPGGAERQVKATAVGLAKVPSQKPLRVLCRSLDPKINADFFADDIQTSNVAVSELQMPREYVSQDGALQLMALLPEELREIAVPLYLDFLAHKPTVVHLWQDRIALAGAFAALLAGTPRIVMSVRSTRPDARRRFRPYQKQLFKSLISAWPERITVINNSKFGARDYEDWLGLPKGEIGVIRNGFDIGIICKRAEGRADAKIVNLGPVLLGWVGRFTFEKRPDLWTDVAIAMAQADPDFQAIAAGEGPLLSVQQSRVAKLGLSGQILFLGNVRPIEPLMSKFSVLLLTSEREGLPNVLVEAQALGVPVVTTDAGGASEAVHNGKSGFVIKGDRPKDALIETVSSIVYDPMKRELIGQAARIWALEEFSLDRMIDKTLAVFKDGPGA